MLKRLILENWKSHKNTNFFLEKGYNVFVGDIGSGKTSIFDGIVFALFGTTPNINSRKILSKDVIMAKPVQQDSAKVILEFNVDNEEYKIERLVFQDKSSQAKIYKNGVLTRGPKPSDVTEEVEKILNINMDSFMKSNYAEQNAIDFFLKLPAGERKQLFDGLFDISYFDDIATGARQTSNKLKTKLEETTSTTSEYKKLLETYNEKEIKEKINAVTKNIEQIKEEIINMQKQFAIVKENEKEITKQKIEFESLTATISNLNGKKSYLEKESEKYKAIEQTNLQEIEKQLCGLQKESITNKETKNKLDDKHNELKSTILFLTAKIKDLESKKEKFTKIEQELKEIPKDISEITNKIVSEIEKIQQQATQNETKIERLEKEIKSIEKLDAHCPLCEQDLSHEHKTKILHTKQNEFVQIKERLEKEKEDLHKAKKGYEIKNKQREFYNRHIEEFNKTEKELEQLEDYKSKFAVSNKELKEFEEKLKEILERANKIEKETKELEEKIKIQKDKQTKTEDLAKITVEIQNAESKFKKIIYNPEEYLKIKTELEKINIELRYKAELQKEKEKQLEEEKFKEKQFSAINQNLQKAERKSLLVKQNIEDLDIFGNIAKKTQEQVRELVVQNINLIFADLWKHIYPYKDFNNIRFNISEGDYKIELEFGNNYTRELDEFISGGERSAIALALRIAMSLVMRNKLNLIVLDEPTHNLDKTTVLSLSEMFNNHLPQFVDQIFVITHDRVLENYAKNTYHISRNKETDGATEVLVE